MSGRNISDVKQMPSLLKTVSLSRRTSKKDNYKNVCLQGDVRRMRLKYIEMLRKKIDVPSKDDSSDTQLGPYNHHTRNKEEES